MTSARHPVWLQYVANSSASCPPRDHPMYTARSWAVGVEHALQQDCSELHRGQAQRPGARPGKSSKVTLAQGRTAGSKGRQTSRPHPQPCSNTNSAARRAGCQASILCAYLDWSWQCASASSQAIDLLRAMRRTQGDAQPGCTRRHRRGPESHQSAGPALAAFHSSLVRAVSHRPTC